MARLQRKRTFDQKKRRSSDTTSSASDVDGLTPVDQEEGIVRPVKTEPSPGSSSVEQKKKVPAVSFSRSSPFANRGVPAFVTRWPWLERSYQFLREVKIELKKVVWPSKKQALGSTLVVLILVLIISVFLGIVDEVLTRIVRLVLQ